MKLKENNLDFVLEQVIKELKRLNCYDTAKKVTISVQTDSTIAKYKYKKCENIWVLDK